MNTLERLREELRKMEEANSRGELNQNELSDLERLRNEIANAEKNAIEERQRQINEYDNSEIDRIFSEDEWYRTHIDELNQMRASQSLPSFSDKDRIDLQNLETEFNKRRQEYAEKYNDSLISNSQEKIETLDLDEQNQTKEDSAIQTSSLGMTLSDENKHTPKHMKPSDEELGFSDMTIQELMKERDHLRNTLFNTGIELPQYKENLRHRIEQIETEINKKMKARRNDNALPSGPQIKGNLESGVYGELPPAKEEIIEETRGLSSGIKGYLPGDVEKITEPIPPIPPEPIKEPNQEIHVKRTLEQILSSLMAGDEVLGLSNKDLSRAQARNINVFSVMSSRLGDGPLGYKLARSGQIVGHGITAIASIGQKVRGNILSTEESRKKIEIFKKRLEELPVEDLETIYREYRGVKVVESKLPDFMNSLIVERIKRYQYTEKTSSEEIDIRQSGMTVEEIQREIGSLYNQIYKKQEIIDGIEIKRENGHITDKIADRALQKAANGSVDIIKRIKELQTELSQKYVGTTGMHSFEEDIKAAKSGMNLQGRIGAKKNNEITEEIQNAWAESAEFDREVAVALAHGNDLDALEAFVSHENTISKQTAHKNSLLWGKKSVGIREYTPIARELDYREDPLLKDVTSSVAQVTSMITLANGILTEIEKNKMVEAHNADISRINNSNMQTMDQVHQSGEKITSHSETFGRGMAANTHQAQAAEVFGHERQELDRSAIEANGSWEEGMTGGFYNNIADSQNHAEATQALKDVTAKLSEAQQKLNSKQISASEYVNMVSKISNEVQEHVTPEYQSILDTMREYSQSVGMDFDLDGQMGELQYLVDHMQDISDMNNAMTDVTKVGEYLQQLDLQKVPHLAKLPSSLLAQAVASTMLFNASRKLSTETEIAKLSQPENEVTRRVEQDTYQNESGSIIESAEDRYYNLNKFKKAMATLQWHKFLKLKDKEKLETSEVEEIKGMFR